MEAEELVLSRVFDDKLYWSAGPDPLRRGKIEIAGLFSDLLRRVELHFHGRRPTEKDGDEHRLVPVGFGAHCDGAPAERHPAVGARAVEPPDLEAGKGRRSARVRRLLGDLSPGPRLGENDARARDLLTSVAVPDGHGERDRIEERRKRPRDLLHIRRDLEVEGLRRASGMAQLDFVDAGRKPGHDEGAVPAGHELHRPLERCFHALRSDGDAHARQGLLRTFKKHLPRDLAPDDRIELDAERTPHSGRQIDISTEGVVVYVFNGETLFSLGDAVEDGPSVRAGRSVPAPEKDRHSGEKRSVLRLDLDLHRAGSFSLLRSGVRERGEKEKTAHRQKRRKAAEDSADSVRTLHRGSLSFYSICVQYPGTLFPNPAFRSGTT